MSVAFVGLLLIGLSQHALSGTCPNPPGASNYTNSIFNKLWYEIGKIQTFGGGIFESDCVCTNINVKFDSLTNIDSNATVANKCNKLTPNGKIQEAISQIYPLNKGQSNGKFLEKFTDPNTGTIVNYNVIFLSDTAAVEYDCGGNEYINYCFHVLSSTPTMSQNEVNLLLQLVDQYQLNPNGLPFKYTNQTGCIYQ
mmetsp:Transcript_36489/g.45032  ORF Transcript_36489/g.45032 Transcript_36489/m.45032 type:complete len:196 (+) Transcript_36489:58-645(+)